MAPATAARGVPGVDAVAAAVAVGPDRRGVHERPVRLVHGRHVVAAAAPDVQLPVPAERAVESGDGRVRGCAALGC